MTAINVRTVVIFLLLSAVATLGAILFDRPSSVLLGWVGGFLFGMVTEFRCRGAR